MSLLKEWTVTVLRDIISTNLTNTSEKKHTVVWRREWAVTEFTGWDRCWYSEMLRDIVTKLCISAWRTVHVCGITAAVRFNMLYLHAFIWQVLLSKVMTWGRIQSKHVAVKEVDSDSAASTRQLCKRKREQQLKFQCVLVLRSVTKKKLPQSSQMLVTKLVTDKSSMCAAMYVCRIRADYIYSFGRCLYAMWPSEKEVGADLTITLRTH